MTGCPHNDEHIKFIDEGFWDAKVRCSNCGEVFDVKGWARRGTGRSFFDGFTGGIRSLIWGDIVNPKD